MPLIFPKTPYNKVGYPLPTPTQRVKKLLRSCENWWDVGESYTAGAQSLPNLGTVGSATDLRFGSSTGVDSRDPTGLAFTGTPYFSMGATAGNYLSVPAAANLRCGPTDIVVMEAYVTSDSLTATTEGIIAKTSQYRIRRQSTTTLLVSGFVSGVEKGAQGTSNFLGLGTPFWVRGTIDPLGGNLLLEESPDRVTWRTVASATGGGVLPAGSTLDAGGDVELGSRDNAPSSAAIWTGKVFRGIITKNGTTVLDVSAAGVPSNATSFTCATGQTVTINTATSGHKTSVVTTTMLRDGTDDFMEAAYHASFDPGAGDFTALWMGRQKATPTNYGLQACHRTSGGGWYIGNNTTSLQHIGFVTDGTTPVYPVGATYASGAVRCIGLQIDRTAQQARAISNGVLGTPLSIAALGAIATGAPFRLGADTFSGAASNWSDIETRGALTHRGLLTAQQLADINTYYQQVMA